MAAQYCSDCDYCGEIKIVINDPWGGTCCGDCLKNIESKSGESAEQADTDDDFDFVEDHEESAEYFDDEYNRYDFYRDNRGW